jgi:hypothetical protein
MGQGLLWFGIGLPMSVVSGPRLYPRPLPTPVHSSFQCVKSLATMR